MIKSAGLFFLDSYSILNTAVMGNEEVSTIDIID
jgi:hypothetical protein